MPRLLLATLAATLCLAPAAQAQSAIQPGAMLQTEAGQCTLNFVYDGLGRNAGKVYIGTAAHCGDKVGQEARDVDDKPFGAFAFIADADDAAFDYAFIEVAPEHLPRVDPALKGHPELPKGFTTPEETEAGDLIQMSGYGLGFGETQTTQEQRQTVLQSDDADIFTLSGPSVNGDSGGPFVHIPTGKALGLVSQYGFTHLATDVGPTIEGVLAKAAKAGFPVSLRVAGQPAPTITEASPEAAPQPAPSAGASEPSPEPAAQKKAKKSKRQKACERKAKKAKAAKKRRAALKRCAKRG
jgi:hypothetical protein